MQTLTNTPAVFNFDSHAVRTLVVDDAPWFVAADVTDALGLHRTQTRRLDDDEKGVRSVHTPSGEQEVGIINESGLYSLVLGSRKPEAKRFKKWVTSEVLPAIRITGRYESQPYAVNPADTLTESQQETLRQMMKEACAKLPKDKQASFNIRGWSKLKAHFRGLSYRQIPQAEFCEAVSLVARHVIEGEFIAAAPSPAPQTITPSVLQRFLLVMRDGAIIGTEPVGASAWPVDGNNAAGVREFISQLVSIDLIPEVLEVAMKRLLDAFQKAPKEALRDLQ